jgi:hypothetical protein
LLALGAALLLHGGTSAHAAVACVGNTAQLALVLNAAQNNGEDDVIKVETGTYLLNAELDYLAATSETFDIAIYGGYAPGCASLATSGSSVLDAQNGSRAMYILGRGRMTVYGLVFQHGNPGQAGGGALVVSGGANTLAAVANNSFVGNQCPSNSRGSAIQVGAETILLNNNLFIANSGGSAISLYPGFVADVNNNTVVGNQLANHVGIGAFNPASSAGTYYVSNNVFWGNEGSDIYDQSGSVQYFHNDIGVRAGQPPLAESADMSVDPQFDGLLSVRPAPSSPLVNAGYDMPYGGIGSLDLGGGQRLIGAHVDIGAYESDVLLRADFGP